MAETASQATGAPTKLPTNKVISGGIWGAVVTVAVFVLNTYVLNDNKIPAEVASALTVIVSSIAAYFTRPSSDQTTLAPPAQVNPVLERPAKAA